MRVWGETLSVKAIATALQVASQANTGFVASLLRPSQMASSGLDPHSSLLAHDSSGVLSVPATMLDPLDPAENIAVSVDRQALRLSQRAAGILDRQPTCLQIICMHLR